MKKYQKWQLVSYLLYHLDMDRETEEDAYVWNAERRRSEKVTKQAKGFCVFRATVKDGVGGMATGTKSEKAASFGDFIEKAETGAIGRALAALGYGTQFTGDEWEEAHRIVDSPVERQPATASNGASSGGHNPSLVSVRPVSNGANGNGQSNNTNGNNRQPAENEAPVNATEQQLSSIRKLCDHLGKSLPAETATLSYAGARKMIQQLTAEYRESKQNNKAS
ncbi:hypothetical protein [Dictyobacter kobayashii]|uniref:Uncharacterized protein n=1 Tax=Dictyobacter kobayashii TaxID=2014872 RepID=A0A402AJG3_9CHLR|nr:hypothetical protein [Dictyobacter kobayashii]GCE19242.1 hypothetical protein KDK_30420 [Dictyobacter kobayashii]